MSTLAVQLWCPVITKTSEHSTNYLNCLNGERGWCIKILSPGIWRRVDWCRYWNIGKCTVSIFREIWSSITSSLEANVPTSRWNSCTNPCGPLKVTFGGLKMFPGTSYFWEIQNNRSLKLHFFQNRPVLLQYTSASYCKVLETFMETVLWKPFQLFCRILNYDYRITKAPFLHC